MKQFFYALIMAFMLAGAQTAGAQTGKYYINGKPTTKEQAEKIPVGIIESMENTVEDGEPVVRIKLKESAAKITLSSSDNPNETREERLASTMRQIYEETTLLKEGAEAADFTVEKYAGGELTLSSLRGKVVLLNFWGTWCGPCLRELAPEGLPEVILKRFSPNTDFVFVAIAINDSVESLDKFFGDDKQTNYLYLRDYTIVDPDRAILGLYASQGVPRSFVIDREGKIVLGSMGASSRELERIAAGIAKELGE